MYICAWQAAALPPTCSPPRGSPPPGRSPSPAPPYSSGIERREPAGLGHRVDELGGIGVLGVDLAPVGVRIARAERADALPQLLLGDLLSAGLGAHVGLIQSMPADADGGSNDRQWALAQSLRVRTGGAIQPRLEDEREQGSAKTPPRHRSRQARSRSGSRVATSTRETSLTCAYTYGTSSSIPGNTMQSQSQGRSPRRGGAPRPGSPASTTRNTRRSGARLAPRTRPDAARSRARCRARRPGQTGRCLGDEFAQRSWRRW